MKFINILFICLVAVSCAYTSMELVPDKMQPLDDFSTITMVSGNSLIFAVDAVEDLREVQDKVGLGKTGASNLPTPITVQNGAAVYVQLKLRQGLKKRGISLQEESENKLKTKIHELWVGEMKDGKVGEKSYCKVRLELELHIPGEVNPKWHGDLSVQASSNGTLLDATSLNGRMLESCMNEAIEKLIREEKFQQLSGIKI